MRGSKSSSIIVNKNMTIGEQIAIQKNKKGTKHYIIDSEESVDWLIKKFVAPVYSTKEYREFR